MKYISFLFLFWLSANIYAQDSKLFSAGSGFSANVAVLGTATTNGEVPFWMRTNNYGSMPLENISGSVISSLYKNYRQDDSMSGTGHLWDWGAGVEVRFNAGNRINAQLITGFLKARCGIFQVQAGRTKDRTGLVDSFLSCSAFAVSGNALGIPKLEISIPEYWGIPGTRNLIAIKGTFAIGTMGKVPIYDNYFTYHQRKVLTCYHQKSIYGRIGKPSWRLNFYGGFNHQVMFGNEREYLGSNFDLNPLETLFYVVTGKAYSNDSVLSSKIGNHIGSIDQAVSYDFNYIKATAYHQFFYDVGGLYHLSNIKDGLWGISIENKRQSGKNVFYWSKFLVEFLYSKSQGGELREKPTPSGDEDYYNNYIYVNGWTYNNENIGNNFFTNKKYQRKELPHYNREYIGNNRIMLLNLGVLWKLNMWAITNRFSFSRNYGTYATSPIGNTTGDLRKVQPPPYFSVVDQFSGYIEASRPLKNNFSIGFAMAGDYGDLLYNSLGGFIKVTKIW